MGMACSTNGAKRNAYGILVGKPEGKRPLGRPRRRWVDNIKMDLREIGWGGIVWTGRMTKSRRMRWAGHVARMGRNGMHRGYWWESQKERDH
jgi:hypothetical protein